MKDLLEHTFHLREHSTSVRTEVLAGLTTFAAMAYILVVNPSILANAGMDFEVLVTVTALAAALGCFLMAALTNYPVALAPGMGTNSYFAFVICIGMEVPWPAALSLTFWNGIVFLLLTVTGLRERIADAIPHGVKVGIQCGIGFFIAFIGLKSVGIVVPHDVTFVSIGNLTAPSAVLVLAGFILMVFLSIKRVAGSILLTIIALTLIGLFVPAGGGRLTSLPDTLISAPKGIGETFFILEFSYPLTHFRAAFPVIVTLLILDMFDSIGTLVGLSRRARLIDDSGRMPKMGRALAADSIATIGGAILGTSTTTSYIESAVGVESGGRTGLTAVVVGVCFVLALVLSPVINIVPSAATAPALMMVGVFMAQGLRELKFDDLQEVAPAFLTMLMIPLTFSITEGIGLGLIVYLAIMLLNGRGREVPKLSYLITLLLIAHYVI